MSKGKVGSSETPKVRHPLCVAGFTGSNHELGRAIGQMRYDQIVTILEGLSDELARQAKGDHERKRYQLSGNLTMLVGEVKRLAERFTKLFRICRPYMLHELDPTMRSKQDKRKPHQG